MFTFAIELGKFDELEGLARQATHAHGGRADDASGARHRRGEQEEGRTIAYWRRTRTVGSDGRLSALGKVAVRYAAVLDKQLLELELLVDCNNNNKNGLDRKKRKI